LFIVEDFDIQEVSMARILLADDDDAMLDLVGRALSSDGHEVVVAHDGQEALDKATGAATAFQIVVTDVQMPIVDGISLTEQLRSADPALRVVLMSGLASEMARAGRMAGPNVQFLQKPFTLEQIRAVVRRLAG
jgi:CheY-like chemotaxis protein